jgi:hypothetical protein
MQEACDTIALVVPVRDLVWVICTYLIENRVVVPRATFAFDTQNAVEEASKL